MDAQAFGEHVHFVTMDAHNDKQLNMRFSIAGYPTVMSFTKGAHKPPTTCTPPHAHGRRAFTCPGRVLAADETWAARVLLWFVRRAAAVALPVSSHS